MEKTIKIIEMNKYIGAVKLGKCPMYAITTPDKRNDLIEGLKEDFPDYKISPHYSLSEKKQLAHFIVKQYQNSK
jgi:hypothetical protein